MDTTALVPGNGVEASSLMRAFQQEYSSGQREKELIQSPRAYNCLRRVLSAVGYEVITEGETLEGSVQRQGTMHVRTEGQNFEVLLEEKLSKFKDEDDNLLPPSPGFTYFHLEGPSEYAQFILDYELAFQPSRWEKFSSHLLAGGAAAAIAMGSLGIVNAFSSSGNFPLWGYAVAGLIAAGVSSVTSTGTVNSRKEKRLEEFCEKYSRHLSYTYPLLAALHLSEVPE